MLTNREGEHTKRAPIGVYNKTIVCKNCEGIWQEWDKFIAAADAQETTTLSHTSFGLTFRQSIRSKSLSCSMMAASCVGANRVATRFTFTRPS